MSLVDVILRLASARDIPAILDLGRLVIPEVYAPLVGQDYAQGMLNAWWTAEAFQRSIETGLLLVAEGEGGIIGMAEWELQGERAILWKLYLHPAWRGRGVGKALVAEVRRRLPPGTRWLYTEYLTANTAAAAFYAGQGFVFDSIEPDLRLPDHSYTWVRQEVIC